MFKIAIAYLTNHNLKMPASPIKKSNLFICKSEAERYLLIKHFIWMVCTFCQQFDHAFMQYICMRMNGQPLLIQDAPRWRGQFQTFVGRYRLIRSAQLSWTDTSSLKAFFNTVQNMEDKFIWFDIRNVISLFECIGIKLNRFRNLLNYLKNRTFLVTVLIILFTQSYAAGLKII